MHFSIFLSSLTITSLALPVFSLPHLAALDRTQLKKRIEVGTGFCPVGTCPVVTHSGERRRSYVQNPAVPAPANLPPSSPSCEACTTEQHDAAQQLYIQQQADENRLPDPISDQPTRVPSSPRTGISNYSGYTEENIPSDRTVNGPDGDVDQLVPRQ